MCVTESADRRTDKVITIGHPPYGRTLINDEAAMSYICYKMFWYTLFPYTSEINFHTHTFSFRKRIYILKGQIPIHCIYVLSCSLQCMAYMWSVFTVYLWTKSASFSSATTLLSSKANSFFSSSILSACIWCKSSLNDVTQLRSFDMLATLVFFFYGKGVADDDGWMEEATGTGFTAGSPCSNCLIFHW